MIMVTNSYYKSLVPPEDIHRFDIMYLRYRGSDDVSTRIKVDLRFDSIQKYVRLFHAFHALHDRSTHDNDSFVTCDEERNLQFIFKAPVSYVEIGPVDGKEGESYWTENIPHEDVY